MSKMRWRSGMVVTSSVRASAASTKQVEAPVGDGAAVEDAVVRIAPLECGDDVEQRHGDQAHRRGDGEPVAVLGPRHHDQGADGDQQTGEAQPGTEGRRDHRAPREIEDVDCISPGVGASKPRPRASEHVDREVDPQDLQRQERGAVGDVEDAGADEGEDEAGQHDHLDPDVLHQVVVEPPPTLDRGDDRGEVVVGEDHLGRVLGDLGAGDAHGHADVGPGQRGGVVHAVAGHGDDVALAA